MANLPRRSTAKPGRRPVSAGVKHEVILRDENRCTYVSPEGRRCAKKRWLHAQHIKEVSQGALNDVSSLCHILRLGRLVEKAGTVNATTRLRIFLEYWGVRTTEGGR